ncbi:D-glycero-beta-D-manno-heptose 1,7-bisphosphate 7-phosphatase [Comamonas terrigena]|uniref:D-glycero-beta-D-manno-heptose 1,7-bisphosphate 7-phosphatase n=1 Tax=Comamonas terrigena TaxID=32013 RepID=UPI002447B07A|nr:D-glycero-beta-D-manno-heptose 1,7-bisphosphate 7-phosphatase [Comamonas terrigena]MDH1289682.1 D-glycero-beta-D-manno-heptose 1,7-bisphosphate 7-phosphatase [Comamonas terrigena]
MTMSVKSKAAFIDRDGVINEERNYVHRIEDFVLLPGVIEGLALLRDADYRLIVVTNQAGISRGYYDQAAMEILHNHLRAILADNGIELDAIYFCPHHPQGCINELAIECDCRKPAPGMLLKAARDFDLDLSSSILIGDKLSDIQAGKRAGVGQTVIVKSGHFIDPVTKAQADFIAEDLLAAARALTGIRTSL